MAIDEAVKDIQNIYDVVKSFNQHIQDVGMDKIPEIKQALKNVFDENEFNSVQKGFGNLQAVLDSITTKNRN